MTLLASIALLTVLFALVTWLVGWWGIVPVSLVAGILLRERRWSAAVVALSAGLSWAALLAVNATVGRFAALASTLAGTLRLAPAALVALTVLYPTLLAWSAAVVGAATARTLQGRHRTR